MLGLVLLVGMGMQMHSLFTYINHETYKYGWMDSGFGVRYDYHYCSESFYFIHHTCLDKPCLINKKYKTVPLA